MLSAAIGIFSDEFPTMAGDALDLIGNWTVQLIRHTTTDGFLLYPLECGMRNTCRLPISPRASSAL